MKNFRKIVCNIGFIVLVLLISNSCSNTLINTNEYIASRALNVASAETQPLIADGDINTGSISISQSETSLLITFSVNTNYRIKETNVWVGTDVNLVPHNKAVILLSHFENSEKYTDLSSTETVEIPIDWSANSEIIVFANASLKGKGKGYSNVDAFAGDKQYQGVTQWNRYFNYTYKAETFLLGGAIQGKALSLSSIVTTIAGSTTPGSNDGVGTAARFNFPASITTDGTNFYIADSANNEIRKMVIASGEVSTFAGSTTAGTTNAIGTAARFNNPIGITMDGTNLYVADTDNNRIRKIVIATGEVTTFAGAASESGSIDGIGTAARFYGPWAITTDGVNLYVADTKNCTIRKIVIATSEVTTLAGGYHGDGITPPGSADGIGTAAEFYLPSGITTDGTNLYVADSGNHKIRKVVIDTAEVTTLAGSTTPGSADGIGAAASFFYPMGIMSDGVNLYVSEIRNSNIREIVMSTGEVITIAGSTSIGSSDGIGTAASFYYPSSLTTDGTYLYVCDAWNHQLRRIQ